MDGFRGREARCRGRRSKSVYILPLRRSAMRVWGKLASNKFKERLSFPIGDATKKIDAVPAAGHVTILYP